MEDQAFSLAVVFWVSVPRMLCFQLSAGVSWLPDIASFTPPLLLFTSPPMGHRLILVIFGRGGVIWRVATCCKRVSTSSLTSNYVGPWHSSVTLLALCPLLSYAGAPSEACTVNAAYRFNSMCRSGSEINLCSRHKCHWNKKNATSDILNLGTNVFIILFCFNIL